MWLNEEEFVGYMKGRLSAMDENEFDTQTIKLMRFAVSSQ